MKASAVGRVLKLIEGSAGECHPGRMTFRKRFPCGARLKPGTAAIQRFQIAFPERVHAFRTFSDRMARETRAPQMPPGALVGQPSRLPLRYRRVPAPPPHDPSELTSRAEPPSKSAARNRLPTGVSVSPTTLKMAPPPHRTFRSRFPCGATLNIVGPQQATYRDVGGSNNIENGTAAAHFAVKKKPPSAGR